ncbi:hypothetical protein Tsedi_01154 [Tepidimonas sediminis]|uniref:DUF3108 domain-containing protein n=1 Tax=Tepidimonas sediminis TaxID=2588941 RepID=A0A554WQS7_9BURK|nr:hypothetical protein Tsedi_01154 [Tepidimonas sediminis]
MIALAVAGAHAAVLAWLAIAPPSALSPAGSRPLPGWVTVAPAAPAVQPASAVPAPRPRGAASRPAAATPTHAVAPEPGPLPVEPEPAAAAAEAATTPPTPPDQGESGQADEPLALAARAAPPAAPAAAEAAADDRAGDAAAPGALVWPRLAELRYDVEGRARGVGYRAEATLRWHASAARYETELTLRALWLQRAQHSSGELLATGLRPQRFADRGRRERVLTFTWSDDGGQARRDGDEPALPVAAGTQDRLSLFAQLGALLMRDGAQPGQRWTLPVAGFGGVQPWTFEVEGDETLAMGPGPVTAVRLRRLGHGGGPDVTLWYAAASWGPLPVRVRLRETDDQLVDQTLREGRLEPAP